MLYKTLAFVLAALAALSAVNKAEACDACAAFFKQRQTFEGKLVKVLVEDCPPEEGTIYHRPAPITAVWVLKSVGKKYELKLGSRTLTRLAAKFESCDVVVTGKHVGGTIDVWEMEAKEKDFTGVIHQVKDGVWKLKTADGELNLIFEQKVHVDHVKDVVSKRVVIKGRMTVSGVIVSSLLVAK